MMRLLLIAIVLMHLLPSLWADESKLDIMPDFTLKNAAGEDVNLFETLNDSTLVIVDFWATWCGPCLQELPHLNSLHNKYKNLEVLAINTDGRRTSQKAMDYIKEKGYTLQILMDSKREVQKLLEVVAIPETFLIQPDGGIYYHHTGYKPGDEEELESKIVELLINLGLLK
jgi:thiol-disulfide isomerase/thioredoxin